MAKKGPGPDQAAHSRRGRPRLRPRWGPALGQHGVNIMDFCKAFNAKTQKGNGILTPVLITVYQDHSYTFITKTPPGLGPAGQGRRSAQGFRCAEPGQGRHGQAGPGRRDRQNQDGGPQRRELEAAVRIIEGSARSMGIEIEG